MRPSRRQRSTPRKLIGKTRPAFTLVEVVVACVVFVTGVLALQAAITVVLRQAQDARLQALSSEIAMARFESLVHSPCADNTTGSEIARGVRSEWSTAALPGTPARLSNQSVTVMRRGVERTDTYHGAYPCR
ncbi:MAG TPA: hypothetical protein VFZ56_10235 [Gemmatimonadaceae bacterium]